MEYVIALVTLFLFVASVVGSILANMVASGLYDCAPCFARWLINRAVARLPESERERCREEWYADNESWPGGKLGKVRHAVGCWIGARTVGRVASEGKPESIERYVERRTRELRDSKYLPDSEQWPIVFEEEAEEIRKLIVLSRQDHARRSEVYENSRDRFLFVWNKYPRILIRTEMWLMRLSSGGPAEKKIVTNEQSHRSPRHTSIAAAKFSIAVPTDLNGVMSRLRPTI